MKGDPLPAGAHVLRYAAPTKVEIPGTAFVRGQNDEEGLSVNWREAFEGTLEEQLDQIRRVIRLKLKKSGRFLHISVDAVLEHLRTNAPDHNAAVIEDPLEAEEEDPADPSHSLITGLPEPGSAEADRIGDLIAQCIIDPHHPGLVE